jgi:hypothetical protein
MATSLPIAVTAPPPPTFAPPIVTLDAARTGIGATVSATIANGTGKAGDWIGLYEASGAPTSYLQWQYLNRSHNKPSSGATAATVSFTLPLTAGTYNVRLFTDDSYKLTATSEAVRAVPPTLTVGRSAGAGDTVTVTIANGPGAQGDWVGLYNASGALAEYLQWQYLNGSQSGPGNGLSAATISFTLPSAPGTYNVRFFASNSYTLLATSEALVVP